MINVISLEYSLTSITQRLKLCKSIKYDHKTEINKVVHITDDDSK